jgi:hypothetical protein
MELSSNSNDDTKNAVPEAERRSILLRAYAEVPYEKQRIKAPTTPQFVLVFDTETTADESQQLRFGTYQLLKRGTLIEKGVFYGKVEPEELETLKAEAPKHGCDELLSVFDFVHKRFLPTAFKAGGLVVGFNLPFDLSRLARSHEAARVARPPRSPEEIAARIKEETKSSDMPTIGVNYLSANRPLWFTLADCIASKLLSGKAPSVIRAVRFSAKQTQAGLRTVEIAGEAEYRVTPDKNDFYKRVIELRRRVKGDLKDAERRDPDSQEVKNLDMNQLALKILANATSYGIFIELNVEDADDEDALVSIFTSQGKRTVPASERELPGRYYHPLLATLITGAARLMLALTERLAFEHGPNWAFCDTDSMAFANTENLPFDEFVGRVRDVCDWFVPLNPYEPDPKKGAVSILEMEDQNFSREKGKENQLEPLYCFAISAKRYALFNRDTEGRPIIRKASAHGLGHYSAPYGHEEESRDERGSGVRLWEEDVWKQIISAALRDKPREVDYAFRREMLRPAHSRYGSTRPAVLNWFKRYNEGRPYAEQVKPFNFLLTFFTHRQEDIASEDLTHEFDPKLDKIRPVAPYEKDSVKALRRIFDRNSGAMGPVSVKWLRTVADVLRDYHRQPEYKFLGGGWNEEGILRRRHVFADKIEDIGKESDGWEEDEARTEGQDTVLTYPSSSYDRERMIALIKSVGKRELMRQARIAMRAIDAVHAEADIADDHLKRMADAAERIVSLQQKGEDERRTVVGWLEARRDEIGLTALAKILDSNASNLRKMIEGSRKPSKAILARILALVP